MQSPEAGDALPVTLMDAVIDRITGSDWHAPLRPPLEALRTLGKLSSVCSLFRERVWTHRGAWVSLAIAASGRGHAEHARVPCRRGACRTLAHFPPGSLDPTVALALTTGGPAAIRTVAAECLRQQLYERLNVEGAARRIAACDRGMRAAEGRIAKLKHQRGRYEDAQRHARGALRAFSAFCRAWGQSEGPRCARPVLDSTRTGSRCVLCGLGGASTRIGRCTSPAFVHVPCERAYWIRRALLDYPRVDRCPCGLHDVTRHCARPRLRRAALQAERFEYRWDDRGPWGPFEVVYTERHADNATVSDMVEAAYDTHGSTEELVEFLDAIPVQVRVGRASAAGPEGGETE